MHFLKLVTDGQMSNLFSTYCNLNEDTKNHGILGVWQPPTRRWRKQKHISFQKTSTSHYHYNFIAVYIYICIYTNQVVNSKSLFWIFLGAYEIRPSAPGIPQQGVAWQSRQEARPADDIVVGFIGFKRQQRWTVRMFKPNCGTEWYVWERLQETIVFFKTKL